ncbi:DUF7563 family protein [Halobaculum sp. EA56]|uniref:DUF7563 family protein n=1 Tax=Halobaculum sp. EA56 TaxID=3421648 RepID=UPI003EBCBCF1
MPQCVRCGHHVTERFARVFGDNEDVVHRCIGCSRAADLDESLSREERAAIEDTEVLTTWS